MNKRTQNFRRIATALLCLFFVSTMSFAKDKKKSKETVTFAVQAMECKNCQKKVEGYISFEKGVTDMECNLANRTVTVTYRSDKTDAAKLAKAFEEIKMEAIVVPEK